MKGDPAAEVAEAIFKLVMAGPPRFPRVAAEFDLAPPEFHVLRLLGERDSLPMRALAEMLYCDASYVTAIVDKLEGRELIERQPDPADRRVKRIVITPKGVKVREKALRRLFAPVTGVAKLPKSEQKTLRDLLWKAVAQNDAE